MEASAVAAAARAHGIPFAATKVISDEYDFELPQTAHFIDSQGQFRTASFALFAALRPWLWSRIAQLARNSRKAARVLGQDLERLQQDLTQASRQPLEQASEKIAPPATASASRGGGHE
jgi:nicotinamidase-related amidase